MTKANEILINNLKKTIREKSKPLKFISITFLFKLLNFFALNKNQSASVVYKILTFSIIENYKENELKEFFLLNFMIIFKDFKEIPINILLEPLTKQWIFNEVNEFSLLDLEFMHICTLHPKITMKISIKLLDFLLKMLINSIVFASMFFLNKLIF